MDSLDRATYDQPVSEGAPREVNAPLEEGIPTGDPSIDEFGEGSPSRVDIAPLMSQKLIEFFSPFFYCSYNVIACFYVEICTIY